MRIDLTIKNKFNFLLILVFLLGTFIVGLVLSNVLYRQAEAKVTDEGAILMQMISEFCDYTNTHFLDFYQKKKNNQEEFRVAFVPAYAAKEVFKKFQQKVEFKNYMYKDATVNPTNIDDLPNAFEQKLIQAFTENKDLEILSGYTSHAGSNYYYISLPLVLKQESCLQCHENPYFAPQEMIDIYGEKMVLTGS